MTSNLKKAKIRSFNLLLEQPNTLQQLKSIDNEWTTSLLNHYTYTASYSSYKEIPFYLKGWEGLYFKIMDRESLISLRDINDLIIPQISKPITYPYFYVPCNFKDYTPKFYKVMKNSLPKLRDGFENILSGFNADIIYLVDINGVYQIFDYEFKNNLICSTLKYDYINRFNMSRKLVGLNGYVVFHKLEDDMSGFIWLKDEASGKFIDKYYVK